MQGYCNSSIAGSRVSEKGARKRQDRYLRVLSSISNFRLTVELALKAVNARCNLTPERKVMKLLEYMSPCVKMHNARILLQIGDGILFPAIGGAHRTTLTHRPRLDLGAYRG